MDLQYPLPKLSSRIELSELNSAQNAVHHAAQFIAIAGKYLLEEQADDSHTNMAWDVEKDSFVGKEIHGRAKVALHPPTLSLKILGPTDLEIISYSLFGKTKTDALGWLKQALLLKQIDADALKPELHYNIPPHSVDSGDIFPEISKEILEELATHRTLVDIFCKEIALEFNHASEVRTWPHHFDHGVYIPFVFDDEQNVEQSFSVGYAIADSIIPEPYLYVTQWRKDDSIDYSFAPKLELGAWLPEQLKGAALTLSEITNSDNQNNTIKTFLAATISWSATEQRS